MGFSIGIIGLPNAGKSTLFQAFTKKQVDIAEYPFTTINPNVGMVAVPDERLEKLAEALKPLKVTKALISFVDIAGLVRGAHKGEGLGNQFLSHVAECNALLHLIRCFPASSVEHVEKSLDPQRDKEIVETELLLKDLQTIERTFETLAKKAKDDKDIRKMLNTLEKVRSSLAQGIPARELELPKEEWGSIKQVSLLTRKPVIYVLNAKTGTECSFPFANITIDAKEELEASNLSEEERKNLNFTSKLDPLIRLCYNSLDFITFFTFAGLKELRAWSIKRGTKAQEAGGKIHSDFQERFIRAEVIPWDTLIQTGSWTKAKQLGLLRIVGKDYEVQDGDVIEFKI